MHLQGSIVKGSWQQLAGTPIDDSYLTVLHQQPYTFIAPLITPIAPFQLLATQLICIFCDNLDHVLDTALDM